MYQKIKKITKSIKQVDLFGAGIKLNFENRPKYTTYFGGTISLLLVVIMIGIVVQALITMNNKTIFTIFTETRIEVDPPLQTLNQKNFMLGVRIINPYSLTIGNRLFDIWFQQKRVVTDDLGMVTTYIDHQYRLTPCENDNFKINVNNDNLLHRIGDYYCLPKDYILTMQGTQNSQIAVYGTLKVQYCTDSDCLTPSELNQLMTETSRENHFKLETIFLNTIIDQSNRDSLISYLYSDFYMIGNFDLTYRQSDVFLQKSIIRINNSVLTFIDEIEESYAYQMKISEVREQQITQSSLRDIFTINIKPAQISTIYHKEYQRLDTLVSYVGGLFNILIIVTRIILVPYNAKCFKVALANRLYSFDAPQQKDGQVIQPQEELKKFVDNIVDKQKHVQSRFKTLSQRFHIGGRSLFDKTLKNVERHNDNNTVVQGDTDTVSKKHQIQQLKSNFLKEVFDKIIGHHEPLYFGIDVVIACICCKKDRVKAESERLLLKRSDKMIRSDLDIVGIIRRMQEINKLKHVLLDHSQLRLFNYLPKPILGIDNPITEPHDDDAQMLKKFERCNTTIKIVKNKAKSAIIGNESNYNSKQKLMKLYLAYEKIHMQTGLEQIGQHINHKLMKMIDPLLKLCFEESVQLEKVIDDKESHAEIQHKTDIHSDPHLKAKSGLQIRQKPQVQQEQIVIHSSEMERYPDSAHNTHNHFIKPGAPIPDTYHLISYDC